MQLSRRSSKTLIDSVEEEDELERGMDDDDEVLIELVDEDEELFGVNPGE